VGLPSAADFKAQLTKNKKPMLLDSLDAKANKWLKDRVTEWANGELPGCSWSALAVPLRKQPGCETVGYGTVQNFVRARWPEIHKRITRG